MATYAERMVSRMWSSVAIFLVLYMLPVHAARTVTTTTDGKARFVLGNDYGVPISGHNELSFEVKACGNVYLLLTEKIKVAPRAGNYYFVSIGVSKTHRITGIIEGCYACSHYTKYTLQTVLNCTRYEKFWVQWDGQGSVKIGRGSDTKSQLLLKYKGDKSYRINFFHVTSYHNTAEFRFHLPCAQGTYGENCTSVCGNCKCGNYCDPESGSCKNGCASGWTGRLCVDRCANHTYGSLCTPCGRCADKARCDVSTGRCPRARCEPGWVGDGCDRECSPGTHGPYCRPCGQCGQDKVCDSLTGHCPEGCLPGWTGQDCSTKCSPGTHGQNCSQCGHCSGQTACNPETGRCPAACDVGWSGQLCDNKCDRYSYGEGCTSVCGICKNTTVCDHVTGNCLIGCEPGWLGPRCNRGCPTFTYGIDCQFLCGHCANGSHCHQVTGACAGGCQKGWLGLKCNIVEIPNELRITTAEPSSKIESQVSKLSLRPDTIASITLGIFTALLMGVIIAIIYKRATAHNDSRYRVNYSGRNEPKTVDLDFASSQSSSSFDNPGYENVNPVQTSA